MVNDYLRIRPHHRDLIDELEAAALGAGAEAVQRWRPERGTYAACLHWWVRAAMERVIHEHYRHATRETPIDGSAFRGDEAGEMSLHEVLADEDAKDVDAGLDSEVMWARAVDGIARRMVNPLVPYARARETAAIFLDCIFSGTPQTEYARRFSVKPQTISLRVVKAQAAFEAWAREVREEAA